ncbi:hypothetical protein DMC01_09065 [Campylobacter troglodytis]|nr:hypothetical protein DMC01_09065 [Campylobacter troglodytis]
MPKIHANFVNFFAKSTKNLKFSHCERVLRQSVAIESLLNIDLCHFGKCVSFSPRFIIATLSIAKGKNPKRFKAKISILDSSPFLQRLKMTNQHFFKKSLFKSVNFL